MVWGTPWRPGNNRGDAIRAIQTAVERKPDGYEAYLALGNAMRIAGDMTGARPHFEKTASGHPPVRTLARKALR